MREEFETGLQIACAPSRRFPIMKLLRWIYENDLLFPHLVRGNRSRIRFTCWVEMHYHRSTRNVPIHPLRLTRVDPHDIRVQSLADPFGKGRHFPRFSPVCGGEWDHHTQELRDYDLFHGMLAHFREGVDWHHTDFYQRVVAEIKQGHDWYKWGCETVEDFEERLARLDRLYQYIAECGYKTQRELQGGSADPIDDHRTRRSAFLYPPELHEITVHIGRSGNYIFHDGRHRLAIAQALDLDSIPVRIAVRHQSWVDRL